MTAVAQLAFSRTDHPQRPPSSSQDIPTTISFEEHLARARERDEHVARRGYSFASLGMFGLHSAVFAQEGAETHISHPVALLSSATGGGKPDSFDRDPEIWVPAGQPAMPAPEASPAGSAAITPSAAALVASPSLNPQVSGRSDRAMTGDVTKKAQPPSSARRLQTSFLKSENTVTVVLSGTNRALKIALRSPAGPVHEIPKLKRLVEATVAEFEMDIAELHVNGSMSQPSFSLGGGVYGGRGR